MFKKIFIANRGDSRRAAVAAAKPEHAACAGEIAEGSCHV
jgi:hypothetical protein